MVQLEDQKNRHYHMEDRGYLRNIHSSDLPKFLEKYLSDLGHPLKIQEALAVGLEYRHNAENTRTCT